MFAILHAQQVMPLQLQMVLIFASLAQLVAPVARWSLEQSHVLFVNKFPPLISIFQGELAWSTVLLELMREPMEAEIQFVLDVMVLVQHAVELDRLLAQVALVHCLFMEQIHAKRAVEMDNTQ